MSNDITIDEIVRRSLAMHHMPMHYYLEFLLHAKRGLKVMHFRSLPSMETARLDVEATGVAYLPNDFVKELYVATEVGDKLRLLSRSDKLNRDDNGGVAYEKVDPYNYLTDKTDEQNYGFIEIGDMDLVKGQLIKDRYTVNRAKGFIRVDNRSTITQVYLRYQTMPKKVSSKSVIHPLAEDALLDYIAWKWAEHNPSNRFEPRTKRFEFFNSQRLMIAQLKKFNKKDIMDHHREVAN